MHLKVHIQCPKFVDIRNWNLLTKRNKDPPVQNLIQSVQLLSTEKLITDRGQGDRIIQIGCYGEADKNVCATCLFKGTKNGEDGSFPTE